MSLARLALLLLLVSVTACLAPAPAPAPSSVVPASAYNGEDTPISVLGSSFYPAIALADGAAADAGFHVRLVGPTPSGEVHEIVFVDQVDLGTLSAVVPRGLAVGTYDVQVEASSGRIGTVAAALSITDTRIDSLVLTPDALNHEVLTSAHVAVGLLDAKGDTVADDLEISVELTALDGGAVDGSLGADGLEDVTVITPTRLTGHLGADGAAVLAPVLATPGDARLTVRATRDERIREGTTSLAWTRGRDLTVAVELPAADFSVRAGSPFTAVLRLVDTHGNPADDAVALVAITDTCNSWGAVARLAPTATVTVVPKVAAPSRCPEERLTVTGSGVLESRSEAFTVTSGPLAALEAEVLQGAVEAGRSVNLLVRPVDAFGNPAAWSGRVVTVDDGGGGVSTFTCQQGSTYFCTVTMTRADAAVRLGVRDDGGFVGTSNAFAVTPGAPAALHVDYAPVVWTAGVHGSLSVAVVDTWDNVVTTAPLAEAALDVEGDAGVVDCDVGTPGDGLLDCVLYEAGPDTLVVTAAGTPPLAGQVALDVVNGPLDHVAVLPAAYTVAAGAALPVRLIATDAFGNPWSFKYDDAVTVTSSDDAFADVVARVGFAGVVDTAVTPTRSGYTDVVVLHGGVEVGRSEPVLVAPGATVRLAVTALEPWAWVGEPLALRIEALDAWGNRGELSDVVTVVADSGAADTTVPLQNGLGEGTITWGAWHLDDHLVATASTGGATGRFGPFSALVGCAPPASPSLDASFGGSSFARACSDAEGVASVTAQLSGVPATGASIVAWGLAVDGAVAIGAQAQIGATVVGDGVHGARALAVQGDGCASELETSVWVGPLDGLPVGPLDVVAGRSELDLVGGRSTTTVRVQGARGCDGAIVVGAPIRLRTDRGALTGLAPSGAGLTGFTDATGSVAAMLDMATAKEGGAATVAAWRDGGLAYGAVGLGVRGDRNPPVVRSFSVEGAAVEVSTAVVTFSERLDPATVLPGAIQLSGPWSTFSTVRPLDAGRSIAIDFDPPLPPTPDGWQLTVQPSVRDVAGNALAGTWAGYAVAWSGWFGATSAVDPVHTCAVEAASFRPDGDDGAGDARDAVRFTFASDSLPVWWVLTVADRSGAVVRALQAPPTGTSDGWSWDGRDDTGRVVPAGRYQLAVDSRGSKGNRGGACTRAVTVDLVEVTP